MKIIEDAQFAVAPMVPHIWTVNRQCSLKYTSCMRSSPVDNPCADSPTQMISYITESEQGIKNPNQPTKKPPNHYFKQPNEPSSTRKEISDVEVRSGIWFF